MLPCASLRTSRTVNHRNHRVNYRRRDEHRRTRCPWPGGSGASAGFSYDSDSKKGLRMTKPITRDPIYRRRVFDAEVIELCVRWYITYRLSYRDLVAMMAERGVTVAHSTILRWVIRYVPEFEKRWSRDARRIGSSWRVDE